MKDDDNFTGIACGLDVHFYWKEWQAAQESQEYRDACNAVSKRPHLCRGTVHTQARPMPVL